jgi:hypothetical protein
VPPAGNRTTASAFGRMRSSAPLVSIARAAGGTRRAAKGRVGHSIARACGRSFLRRWEPNDRKRDESLILKVFTTLCKHKMNLHSVLLNDSFALDFICATPLEQFQILPLSAQVYPASASISSLEQCNLFPQVSTDSEFVYISGAGLAAKLTS